MQRLARVLRLANALPVALACTALFVLMVMTFCDVILRSTFDSPIEAATEITRILMAIVVFAMMPGLSARGGHIAVDLADPLIERLRLTHLRDALVQIGAGVMLVWPVLEMWKLTDRVRGYGEVTEYLAIPQYLPSGFITIFTAITALMLILSGLLLLAAPKSYKALT